MYPMHERILASNLSSARKTHVSPMFSEHAKKPISDSITEEYGKHHHLPIMDESKTFVSRGKGPARNLFGVKDDAQKPLASPKPISPPIIEKKSSEKSASTPLKQFVGYTGLSPTKKVRPVSNTAETVSSPITLSRPLAQPLASQLMKIQLDTEKPATPTHWIRDESELKLARNHPIELSPSKKLKDFVTSPFKKMSLLGSPGSGPSTSDKVSHLQSRVAQSPEPTMFPFPSPTKRNRLMAEVSPIETGMESIFNKTPEKRASESLIKETSSNGITPIPILATPRDCILEHVSATINVKNMDDVLKEFTPRKKTSLKNIGSRILNFATSVFKSKDKKTLTRFKNRPAIVTPAYHSKFDVSDDEYEPVLLHDVSLPLSAFRKKTNPTFARVYNQTPKVERSLRTTKIPRRRSFGSLSMKKCSIGRDHHSESSRSSKRVSVDTLSPDEAHEKVMAFRARFIDKIKLPVSPLALTPPMVSEHSDPTYEDTFLDHEKDSVDGTVADF